MKALLFAEMSKLEIDKIDEAASKETKGGETGEIVGGYMDIHVADHAKKDDFEEPDESGGYMEAPEPDLAIGVRHHIVPQFDTHTHTHTPTLFPDDPLSLSLSYSMFDFHDVEIVKIGVGDDDLD